MRLLARSILLSTCLLGLFLPCQSGAGPAPLAGDQPASYSHLLPITASGDEPVVQLRLTQAVYLHSRSEDLSDLRIFDAQGTPLPFAIVEPAPQEAISKRTLTVKVFPMFRTAQFEGKHAEPVIRALPDGSALVIAGAHKPGSTGAVLDSLIFDLRQPGNDGRIAAPFIDALRFALPEATGNYTARVELAVSDDLQEWNSVGETLLSWLSNASTETLANDRIEFAPLQARYARLRWSEGTPLNFAAVSAESPVHTAHGVPMEHLVLPPLPGRIGQDLVYQSAKAIPVKTIGLQFTESNVILPAQLGRYVQMGVPDRRQVPSWQFIPDFRATFYHISQGSKQHGSGDFALSNVHQERWVLRPEAAMSSSPELRIGWVPATVIFMRSGKGPYILAIGRDNARAAAVSLDRVAPGFSSDEIASLEQVTIGQARLQHPAAVTPAPVGVSAAPLRGRIGLLWAVLLLGLGLLGAMVWHLLRQMR